MKPLIDFAVLELPFGKVVKSVGFRKFGKNEIAMNHPDTKVAVIVLSKIADAVLNNKLHLKEGNTVTGFTSGPLHVRIEHIEGDPYFVLTNK